MWCTMPLVRSSQRLHLRRDFASNSCIWQSQVVRVYLIMCILGIISCRNQKSSKIWYVLIMPALFQDSFFHKISMGWKVEGGGVLSDSLQVSKHSKPPPVSSSISTSKKKGRHPMVTVQRLASTATPNLLSCLLSAKQGANQQIN